jgi:DNA-binding transcriptional LysR family regulator
MRLMQWDEQRLGSRLKLRDIGMLMAAAKCGSMGKAAAQLSTSQPAISKAIGDMERQLRVRLLDRTPHGVELTAYGSALLDHARVAFDEFKQAMNRIEFLRDPAAGELGIGTSVLLASGFVAAVVKQLSERHPGLMFRVLASESGSIYQALEDREVDLIVARIFAPVGQDHLRADVLYDEPYAVVAAAQSPWSRRRTIQLADLSDEPWVLPEPDSLTGQVTQEAFRHAGLSLPRATVVTASTPMRTALVATGRFLTIVPLSAFDYPVNRTVLRLLPVDLPTSTRPVGVVTLKRRTLSPVAQTFLDCARQVAKRRAKRR